MHGTNVKISINMSCISWILTQDVRYQLPCCLCKHLPALFLALNEDNVLLTQMENSRDTCMQLHFLRG